MMAEINEIAGKRKGPKIHTHRHSTRVDLTPMVDLGFLLITFFVFTTSMAQAKTMGMLTPADGDPQHVWESGAMTIIIASHHNIYYYEGLLDDKRSHPQFRRTNFKQIRSLILQKKQDTDPKKLMYVIKSQDSATYGDTINLLDEMTICNISAGHYAEAEIYGDEKMLIARLEKGLKSEVR